MGSAGFVSLAVGQAVYTVGMTGESEECMFKLRRTGWLRLRTV